MGMERIYMIDQILENRQFVTFAELQQRLEISPATLKRDIAYMRDRLNAPIIFNRDLGGYQYDKSNQKLPTKQYELPGLWFSAEEIHALLTMQHLLSNLDSGGLLGPHIQPLLSRLTAILDSGESEATEIQKRIHAENVGSRTFHLDHFQAVGSALLRRKRMMITYEARGTGEISTREISPQRLVYYRGNWYLDSWCHLRNGVRNFSVDAIKHVETLQVKAIEVTEKDLNAVLGNGYGIFNGNQIEWATLIFNPHRARWVSCEKWHQDQQGKFLEDGSYELKVPYSDDRELIMDILRYGSDVKVKNPPALIDKIKDEAQKLLTQYYK